MSDRESLSGDDKVFSEDFCKRCPNFIAAVLRDLDYNEAHAMELGLLGTLAAVGWHLGYHDFVAYGTAFLLAVMFGLGNTFLHAVGPKMRGKLERNAIARKMIRMNPWYFLLVYMASAGVTTGILTVL